MVSFVGLFVRKPGMTHEEHTHRYENRHATFAMPLTPLMCDYRRNHIVPGSMVVMPHLKSDATTPIYDTITEIKFENQEKLDELNHVLANTDAGRLIAQDEEDQFDRTKITLFLTDEYETSTDLLAPRPAGVEGGPPCKLMCFVNRRADLTRSQFIDYYENHHAPLAVRVLSPGGRSMIAGYKRAYPVEGSPMALPHCPEGASLDFDVLTSFWFWSEADLEAFRAACGDPANAAILAEDEAKFLARETVRMLRVDERVTPPEVIAEKYEIYAAALA